MEIILIDFWMVFEDLISNVDTDQSRYKWFLLWAPSWAGVDKFFNHFITMSVHVLDLKIQSFLNLLQWKFFVGFWTHSLVHHHLLHERSELGLVLHEVLLCDSDFHHDLLLETHTDLLDLSHTLSNHSQILVKVLELTHWFINSFRNYSNLIYRVIF